MKRQIKNTALAALRSARVFTIYAKSARRRERLLILCYHGISLRNEHQWRGGLFISPQQFRDRMELLRANDIRVLSLGEAAERLRSRSLPPRSAVITFDDGFCDFHEHAVPILAEYGYPCTLYLTTHYCNHRVPIFNLVTHYMFWTCRDCVVDLSALGLTADADLRQAAVRDGLVNRLNERAMPLGTTAKNELAAHLAELLNIDYDDLTRTRMLQIMSPNEVDAVNRAGIDIQLHTHRHRTPRDRELFMREIHDNRARIHDLTGRVADHFCYPSGDYAPEFLPWLRECGVKTATTCDLGLAKPTSEPLLYPRLLDATNIHAADFESWLCGFRN